MVYGDGMAEEGSVPVWWIVLFVLLALGFGAGAILFVGGDLFAGLRFLYIDSGASMPKVYSAFATVCRATCTSPRRAAATASSSALRTEHSR